MNNGALILIVGGARAGKSAFALRLAREWEARTSGPVWVIATAEALDDEMRARIVRHRAERPSHWVTIEEPKHLDQALSRARDAGVVIVDCLTMFVANWLLSIEEERTCEQEVERIVETFLATIRHTKQTVICVSNEVGLGVVPDTPLGRAFRDVLGRVNQRVAQAATQVYLLIAGLSVQLKPSDPLTLSSRTP